MKSPRNAPGLTRKSKIDHSQFNTVLRVILLENHHVLGKAAVESALGYMRSKRYDLLYAWAEEINTASYQSPTEHFAHVQLAALILKYPWSHEEIGLPDPRTTAVQKFLAAEEVCRKTNIRFGRVGSLYRSRYFPLLEKMRSYIATVLGHEPDMDEVYKFCSFGSGASIGVSGGRTSPARKLLAERWTCSQQALPYVIRAIWSNDQMAAHLASPGCLGSGQINFAISEEDTARLIKQRIDVVTSNKVSFVPKTAKTHRAIAVEPLAATFVQKGLDVVMRDKLRRFGVDLEDQGRNAELARIGSITGSLGTLDLSSASDTVARQLVYHLLPPGWFRVLNNTRSAQYTLDGVTRTYEKFASMGNGFCFPLETLIFTAAVVACKTALRPDERRFSVYGDDIIASVDIFPLLISLLKFLGFQPNSAKTFYEGPFRESCGADWYSGQDVRPVYLDYHLGDTSSKMIFHNATLRSERCSRFFESVRPLVREMVKDSERLLRPDLLGHGKRVRVLSLLDQRNLNGAFTVPLDVFVGSRCSSWDRTQWRWRWKEFLFMPVVDDLGSSPSSQDASYIAFLSGSLEGKSNLRYQAKRRIILR